MKKVFLLGLLLVSFVSFSQEKQDTIFTDVDVKAEYPSGGEQGFIGYLLKNIKFGKPHENIDTEIKLDFEFVVEPKGKVTNIRILHSINEDIDKQLVKAIKKSKKWKPALVSGEPVRSLYTFSQSIRVRAKNVYRI